MTSTHRHSTIVVVWLTLLLTACAAQPVSTPASVTVLPTVTATLPPPASPMPASPTPTALPPTAAPPTATPQPITPSATPPTIVATPTQVVFPPAPHGDGPCTYQASFLGDVTIPDNTQLAPGTAFAKTWRVRNDGTCTWGSNGYALQSLVFYDGDRLSALNSVGLPGEVPPGSVVDLSVSMVAPQNPGSYRSEWMLSIAGDVVGRRWLGFGAAGLAPLYAQIVVPAPAGEPVPTQTYYSAVYHYAVSYPGDWIAQVNTSVPTGGGTSPEYVTLAPKMGGLPRVQIWVLTGRPPMTGFENCVPNFIFHNLLACKMSLPAGQNPAEDIWVFQKGGAYFYIQVQYGDAGSTQVFDDIMTSFNFTG